MSPGDSPLFFMKEFSNEELSQLLINKVHELKKSKAEVDELNEQLQDNMAHLEELQSQLQEHNDELEYKVKEKTDQLLKSEKLATVGELSARIAHDLRNPLSTLKNTVEIMRIDLEPTANEKTMKKFTMLERAIHRISHQVEDVLDYLRPSNLNISEHSLLLVLQDSLERIEIPTNISIRTPKKDYSIPIDNEKMETVFINIISNAIQVIDENPGRIVIGFKEDGNYIKIEISDNGPGIPSDLTEKIFDPLFTTRQIGTGLGLPSCKSIIERHGGTLFVSSKKQLGTTFTIKLPIKSEFELVGKELDSQNSNLQAIK